MLCLKKLKREPIEAKKVGRIYLIPMAKVNNFLTKDLTDHTKREIEKAVKRTVRKYGEVLKMMGNA